MSKQNKTTAANRGNTNTTTLARVSRWRGHVAKHLSASAKHRADIPAAWFEEVEKRPMVDVVMDWLCKDRGIGVTNRNPEQQCNFEVDEDYERAATRTRNAHENRVASTAVMFHLYRHNVMLADDDLRGMIRRFHHAGDCGIDAAIVRAVKFALNASQDAKAVA